jgi:hypothetical protein
MIASERYRNKLQAECSQNKSQALPRNHPLDIGQHMALVCTVVSGMVYRSIHFASAQPHSASMYVVVWQQHIRHLATQSQKVR